MFVGFFLNLRFEFFLTALWSVVQFFIAKVVVILRLKTCVFFRDFYNCFTRNFFRSGCCFCFFLNLFVGFFVMWVRFFFVWVVLFCYCFFNVS